MKFPRALTGLMFLQFCTMFQSASLAQVALAPQGILAWWPGDGDSSDVLGTHNGTNQGSLSFTSAIVGQGFAMNGANASVDIGPGFTNQEFSIALWVRARQSQVSNADMIDNNHDSTSSWELQYANSQNAFAGLWFFGTAGAGTINFYLNFDTWYHLTCTVDGTHVVRVYLDGNLVASSAPGSTIAYRGSEFLTLGKHRTLGRQFNGGLDEVMYWNRAISAMEVGRIYTAGTNGLCKWINPLSLPTDQVRYVGGSNTFSANVTSSVPLTFQWFKDGSAIAGATNSSLTLTNLQHADSADYTLQIDSVFGTAGTPPARLLVSDPITTSIALYAGVTITGVAGELYGIQYTADLAPPVVWVGITNITMPNSSFIWYDSDSAAHPHRFYRAIPGPISVP